MVYYGNLSHFPISHPKEKMSTILLHLLLLLLLLFQLLLPSSSFSCNNPQWLSDPHSLLSSSSKAKLTVLISGFSPRRASLLRSLSLSYSSHPVTHRVLILWSNPNPKLPSPLLSPLPRSISLIHLPNSSLSSRFLPHLPILTRSVLVADDDILLPSHSLSFAFRISSLHNHVPLVGFFARSHEYDLASKSWVYATYPDRYSLILTKAVIIKTDYLYRYSCDERWREAREYVDRERNCEDILMNFVAAVEGGGKAPPPIVVEAKGGIRDWGDPRNHDDDDGDGKDKNKDKGLSSKRDHRKRRGQCLREFHRLLGEMPLRYSYGKLVEEVGEQALCRRRKKGGEHYWVSCDKQQ